ncbi:putative E3 ubiquitin-protein ligase UBR7-like protein [Leptotrombidium deliense]|uniref:Putative E3 ubiquitin-protein ligase UBR7 n=1 Tax=Leptotrombidium deliense TaxID=299467 RepID=A0A443SVZ3_9ACAR|nr:putative E3 ubiquitin-protein ligase UBR7-like protein [Leptotrombidium deliense]
MEAKNAEESVEQKMDEKLENLDENEERDNIITMVDVLEEEQELEDSAFAVLAGSDDKNCTYNLVCYHFCYIFFESNACVYPKGYMGRQALYACKTCTTKNSQPAGMCLACSLECHEGHDVYELYTKRDFRCDCGNDKFENDCKLTVKKSVINEKNSYNHNFFGRYCTCDRPYPDTDNDEDDQMIQCIVCEDWFHGRHLGTTVPENDEFSELICGDCMNKLPFLWYYTSGKFSVAILFENFCVIVILGQVTEADVKIEKLETPVVAETGSDSGFDSSCDSTQTVCKLLKLRKEKTVDNLSGPNFLLQDWRENLCRCSDCIALYEKHNCQFLCDEKDTVHYYESQGKERSIKISQYERGLNEITKMDRVKSIEAIQECNTMMDHLKDYLKKFAENKKVVREEDIREFFEGLKAKKRPKIEIPHNCR